MFFRASCLIHLFPLNAMFGWSLLSVDLVCWSDDPTAVVPFQVSPFRLDEDTWLELVMLYQSSGEHLPTTWLELVMLYQSSGEHLPTDLDKNHLAGLQVPQML